MKKLFAGILLATLVIVLTPGYAGACACGCGVFDVQTGAMLPTGPGGTVWFDYDYQNQHQNWSGTSAAPAANNGDKQIRTSFYTLGGEYMFNRKWGVEAELPVWDRFFSTVAPTGPGGANQLNNVSHSALGDIRIKGIYTGFSPDMSTGITYGLKLATGDYTFDPVVYDRDSEIGTGSTDLLLGAYHNGRFRGQGKWNWFVNGQLDQPFTSKTRPLDGDYRPGAEFDAATGVYYHQWTVGRAAVIPIAQLVSSYRGADSGTGAAFTATGAPDSGYQRVLLSPGIEIHYNDYKLFADVGIPIYNDVNGDQLIARQLFKLTVSRDF